LCLLLRLGGEIATGMSETYDGRWCFIAGFAYILHGVEKRTNDLDILTKDTECTERLLYVLKRLGFKECKRENHLIQYIYPESETTADIIEGRLWEFIPPDPFWNDLILLNHTGKELPTPTLLDLIVLKAIVYYGRKHDDPKKERDLKDVRSLASIKNLSGDSILERADLYDLREFLRGFLIEAGIC